MTVIRSRAPLRLGLAGGGSDVSPFCDQYGGFVLNASIDRYAYATIQLNKTSEVVFNSADKEIIEVFNNDSKTSPQLAELPLHHAVYSKFIKTYNDGKIIPMTLTTFCDAPPGSGLGSSSTLVVAMIKSFVHLLNLPLDDYEIAQLAFTIERVDCNLSGGKQDQYAAVFGGFNFMEFNKNSSVVVNTLRLPRSVISELEASLILYSTGISRKSAKVIDDQMKSVEDGREQSMQALLSIRDAAFKMKEAVLKADYISFAELLNQGWHAKKNSSSSVSNKYIDAIYETAIDAGASAGKISGAGGGGFMLFYANPSDRMNVIRALNQFAGTVSNCHFIKRGAESWKV